MRFVRPLVLLAIVSCGGGTDPPKAAACATRGASYLVTSTVLSCSGDCAGLPAMSSEIVVVGNDGEIGLPAGTSCSYGPANHENGCISYVDVNCTLTLGGQSCTETENGQVTWASDGSSASGDATYTLACGANAQTVTQTVNYVRQ